MKQHYSWFVEKENSIYWNSQFKHLKVNSITHTLKRNAYTRKILLNRNTWWTTPSRTLAWILIKLTLRSVVYEKTKNLFIVLLTYQNVTISGGLFLDKTIYHGCLPWMYFYHVGKTNLRVNCFHLVWQNLELRSRQSYFWEKNSSVFREVKL